MHNSAKSLNFFEELMFTFLLERWINDHPSHRLCCRCRRAHPIFPPAAVQLCHCRNLQALGRQVHWVQLWVTKKKEVVFFFWPQACTSWWSLSSLWNITSLLEIFLYYHKLVLRISIWFQKLPVCMRIIITTKNAWNATVVAWICLVPIKNEREDSKIKFFAISILRIWLWWRVQISCSSLETSSLKVWDVLWLEGKAPPRLFFRFPLKLAQVF